MEYDAGMDKCSVDKTLFSNGTLGVDRGCLGGFSDLIHLWVHLKQKRREK